MKITGAQRNAASYFWSQILTREIKPKALQASQANLPPFMAVMEAMHTKGYLEKLQETNPNWSVKFMNILDKLIRETDEKGEEILLKLDHEPEGLLLEAARQAELPPGFFPVGKLHMSFDDKGNMLVSGETIDAEAYLNNSAKEALSQLGK